MNLRQSFAYLISLSLLTSCAHGPSVSYTPQNSYMPDVPIDMPSPAGDRSPNAEDENYDAWSDWSKHGTRGGALVLGRIRNYLNNKNLKDPHVGYMGYKPVDCKKTNLKVRSADGTCNYKDIPHAGAAGVAFGRNIKPKYIDHNAEARLMTPNPALVAKEFLTREEFKPVPFLNMLAAAWIQFMNHDWLTHGRNTEKNPFRIQTPSGEIKTIERTKENTIDEKNFNAKFGKVSLNEVTHWWDASQIYGSSQEEQSALRSFSNGEMRTDKVNGREVLPKAPALNVRDNKQNQGYEATGFRDNWWVGLSLLHTLFVKEHNAIAAMLKKNHATYDAKSKTWTWKNGIRKKKDLTEAQLDETIFQTARLINAAIMAKIHTIEWTPAILPNPTLEYGMNVNWYGILNPKTREKLKPVEERTVGGGKTDWFGFIKSGHILGGIVGDRRKDYGVPFSITEEFTSVYRLHSLLPEKLELKKLSTGMDRVNAVDFTETRNEKSYELMMNNDLTDLFYSFGTQLPGQLVLNNFPRFMQELTIPGHETMDLGLVDIVRDRERGVPRYNQFRRAIDLKPIKSFKNFFEDNQVKTEAQAKILEKLERVYGKDKDGNDNVEDIDLLVGTLAEEVRPKHFGFGETLFQIFIVMATRRLAADRFFTDDYKASVYTKSGMDWIDDEGTFAQVILRHMPELKSKIDGLYTAFLPWNH